METVTAGVNQGDHPGRRDRPAATPPSPAVSLCPIAIERSARDRVPTHNEQRSGRWGFAALFVGVTMSVGAAFLLVQLAFEFAPAFRQLGRLLAGRI